jgi:hypothetical protein
MAKIEKTVENVRGVPAEDWLKKLRAATTVTEMKSALSQMTATELQSDLVQAEIVRITEG